MRQTITATNAVRTFSEILNDIKYKGTIYTIVRSGKPIAEIAPAAPSVKIVTLSELPGMIGHMPKLGVDAEGFEEDLRESRKSQPLLPGGKSWE
jgi:antitoxin (DNA-binding transcriptional repressor) of toxin-antitoxin stability system